MKRRRKRRCLGCGEGFLASPQNRRKQRFCGKPECAKKSARASQEKWEAKNPDYFKGRANVVRVQRWREDNPGYWRREKGGLSPHALQENCIVQAVVEESDGLELECLALQKDWFSQPPFVVGLIANLSGSALQEDIVAKVRNLHKRGQEILGIRPGVPTQPKPQIHHEKEDPRSRPAPTRSGPVQLGRSPPDPSPPSGRLF